MPICHSNRFEWIHFVEKSAFRFTGHPAAFLTYLCEVAFKNKLTTSLNTSTETSQKSITYTTKN